MPVSVPKIAHSGRGDNSHDPIDRPSDNHHAFTRDIAGSGRYRSAVMIAKKNSGKNFKSIHTKMLRWNIAPKNGIVPSRANMAMSTLTVGQLLPSGLVV